MVATRQGTQTAAASPATAAAKGPRTRSPRKANAPRRGPSAPKKGAASPPGKGDAEPQRGRAMGSPAGPPRAEKGSAPPAKPKRGRTPRVHVASKAEVISPPGRSGSSRRVPSSGPHLRKAFLEHRQQTGLLPLVRDMSNMSSIASASKGAPLGVPGKDGSSAAQEGTAEEGTSASRPLRRTAAAAAAAGASSATEESSLPLAASPSGVLCAPPLHAGSNSSSSSRLSEGKVAQLLLTYFCYASLYLTRKPFATTKRELEIQLGLSASALGGVDSAFLGAYAASQLLLAPALLGAPGGPSCETILAVAYAVSAGSCFFVCLLPDSLLSSFSLACLWGFNGAAQALAFPLIVSFLSTWLNSKERGGVIGVWATCQQVGSIFASYLTAELLSASSRGVWGAPSALGAPRQGASSWRLAFLVPALWVLGCALLLAWGLKKAPEQGLLTRAATTEKDQQKQQQGKSLLRRTVAMSSIKRLCAAYFCVKLVRYSLLYWMSYYFEKYAGLTSSAAAYYSIYFDAGGVLGSVAVGWLSDRYLQGRRLLLLAPLCCVAGCALLLFHFSVLWGPPGDIYWVSQAALLLTGAAVSAPDSVLGGTATADACADEPDGAAADLAATASCIVNGFGSVGSIVQGLLTPVLLSAYGWNQVFYLLAGTATLGGLSIIPGALRDIQVLRNKKDT